MTEECKDFYHEFVEVKDKSFITDSWDDTPALFFDVVCEICGKRAEDVYTFMGTVDRDKMEVIGE